MEEASYASCRLCPRSCGVNRYEKAGYCGCGANVRAGRAGLHAFEEPFISGKRGSGTVFFSGCPLRCVFCQNRELSMDAAGIDVSEERLSEIFLEEQGRGAHNLNLVTGTHFTPTIAKALQRARKNGLRIPVLWNSSGYEKAETLKLLEGLVDIWMPDFKTLSPEIGARYFHAPEYPKAARESLDFMTKTVQTRFEDDLMVSGVLVRHLMMPGGLKDTKAVLSYLWETYGDTIWISLMSQYTPMGEMPYPELNRRVFKREYEKAVDFAIELGIENCMIQEGNAADESFIPAFDGTGIAAPPKENESNGN